MRVYWEANRSNELYVTGLDVGDRRLSVGD